MSGPERGAYSHGHLRRSPKSSSTGTIAALTTTSSSRTSAGIAIPTLPTFSVSSPSRIAPSKTLFNGFNWMALRAFDVTVFLSTGDRSVGNFFSPFSAPSRSCYTSKAFILIFIARSRLIRQLLHLELCSQYLHQL
ncbi:hypothetical protein CRG98_001441 [Punica granatum]|uniref:Uncharacterized protein n=1 Tax=Punica granatum TaxID=22663 RepID=A0A2I0LBQ3_PUNGR|nr:hypothetical protein CRG98_001441 [Punica granatum]